MSRYLNVIDKNILHSEIEEAKDEEYSMARSELSAATRAIKSLNKKLKGEGELEAWVQSKITKASDYLRAASDYMQSGESNVNEETMTTADKKREKELKKKYDDSNMKANFIKQYGPERGKSVYFAYIRKKAMAEAIELDEAKLSRTERRARNAGRRGYDEKGKPKPKGGIHAFDVDETLFSHGVKGKPNVKVHVKDPSGKRVQSLTNHEFNTFKLPKGHSYDFSEFGSAEKFGKTASPNKKVIKKIKKLQRRGQNVHLITARDKFDDPEQFRQHFARHGIRLSPGNIHYTGGMKGSDVGQKKVAVAKGLAKMGGTSSIHMYDDAAKEHNAFEAEKRRNRGLKIKTHLAQPNKQGEVMLRSYQATKEDFELWIENLLDEGYDLSEFTVDELYETFEYVLDEAITAVGAPAPNDGPYRGKITKRGMPKDINKKPIFKSPYSQGAKTIKKDYKEEVDATPYEFWKSFISEEEIDDEIDDVSEEIVVEEYDVTPYSLWKAYFSEKYIDEAQAPEEDDEDGRPGAPNIIGQMGDAQRRRAEMIKKRKRAEQARQIADDLEDELRRGN